MRILIGATCIAVIAAVGVYLWGEWQERARDARIAQARQQLGERLSVKPGDDWSIEVFCRALMGAKNAADDSLRPSIEDCSLIGYR